MLGKVMKYEWRACGRLLWPLFGLGLAMSVAIRLMFFIVPYIWAPLGTVLNQMTVLLAVLMVMALVLLTFVYTAVRFYQSTLAGEAHLTFTLPVGAGTQVGGRLLVHTAYGVISGLVAAVTVFVLVPGLFRFLCVDGTLPAGSTGLGTALSGPLLSLVPANLLWSIVGFFAVALVLGTLTNILFVYALLAIGTRVSRNHILGGIAAYLVLNTIESVASIPFMLLFMNPLQANNSAFIQRITVSTNAIGPFVVLEQVMGMMWWVLLYGLALGLVFAAAHFIITRYIFTKKLNVE